MLTELWPDFMLRALLACAILAAMAGPVGSVLVWRRMAFFGDALAHAALLGVALALWLHVPILWGILALGSAFALALLLLKTHEVGADTVLGILSPTALAAGLLALSLLPGARADLTSLLFGDVLAITSGQIISLVVLAALVLLTLKLCWQAWLRRAAAPELCPPNPLLEGGFLLLLVAVIAAGVQLVGVLLLSALLIIPAATARRLARTPEQMALGAAALGLLSCTLGLLMSWQLDAPAGPAIVLASALLFTLSRLLPQR